MIELNRLIEKRVVQSLESFPVVYIAGPRQSGKTTITKKIISTKHQAKYITFDDIQVRSSAGQDPDAFLRSLDHSVVLDEVQMVPELFRPLKIIVDENRASRDEGRGKFLLTGSASVMALPNLSDALVGRMVLHTLLPFSAREIKNSQASTFIDQAFNNSWKFKTLSKQSTNKMMVEASFPELYRIKNSRIRYEWCNGYINTILQRDVRVLMEVEKIGTLPNMLRLIAANTGGLLNEASLARDSGLNHITAKRYRLLLESLYLIQSIPAWTRNLGKRLIKSPKLYISDINLLCYLINTELDYFSKSDPSLMGHVLENFVAVELIKQLTFSETHASIYHYRTSAGQEVDFLLEGPQGQVVGIEVKSKSKLIKKDFKHLESLKVDLGEKFKQGFVFYQGEDIIPFGKDMWALPISVLWDEA